MTDVYSAVAHTVVDPEGRTVALAVNVAWANRLAEALTTHERVLAAREKAGLTSTGEQRRVIPLDQIRRARGETTEEFQRVGEPLRLVPSTADGWRQATESPETSSYVKGEPLRLVPPLPERTCERVTWHECPLAEGRWMRHG